MLLLICSFLDKSINIHSIGFQTMSTRHQAEKDLLGDPESVLSSRWLEAFHSGADYKDIIPWATRKLPTTRQVLLQNVYKNNIHM